MIQRLLAASAALLLVVGAADAQPRRRPAAAPATPAGPSAADWRTPDPENILVIETNRGRIIAELEPRMAPQHVERIRTLTRQGFYNGLTFFRVIEGFMAQTGDPQNTGQGESPLPNLPAEFMQRRGPDFPMTVLDHPEGKDAGFVGSTPVISEPLEMGALLADGRVPVWGNYCPGTLGMARSEAENSGNSQFFLMRNTYPRLNRRYTVFGRVIQGVDVVRSIKVGEPVAQPQDQMTRVRILADIPAAERPVVRVVDTARPWFARQVEQRRAALPAGTAFDICDMSVPVEVRDPGQGGR